MAHHKSIFEKGNIEEAMKFGPEAKKEMAKVNQSRAKVLKTEAKLLANDLAQFQRIAGGIMNSVKPSDEKELTPAIKAIQQIRVDMKDMYRNLKKLESLM